jgi:hypothetical protein
MHRFVPALSQQGGARLAQIPVRHHPRRAGKTKYNLTRTVRVLLDLMTVQFLNRFVTRPMHLFGLVAVVFLLVGLALLLASVAMKLGGVADTIGNPLLMLGAVSGMGGVQLLSTGLLGELLSRTYFESQGKTTYVVGETRNVTVQPAFGLADRSPQGRKRLIGC